MLIIISLLNSQLEKTLALPELILLPIPLWVSQSVNISLCSVSLSLETGANRPPPRPLPRFNALNLCSLLHWKAAVRFVKPNLWELHCLPGISPQETVECSKISGILWSDRHPCAAYCPRRPIYYSQLKKQ